MRTLDEILTSYEFKCLDGRDINRLFEFINWETLNKYPQLLEDINEEFLDAEVWDTEIYKHEFTRENVLDKLKIDLAFGFEKALNQRGISAALMFEVVRMWNWILNDDDELANWPDDKYAMYGLQLFKATAIYYGFDNPIDEDEGDEFWYNDADEDFELYYGN